MAIISRWPPPLTMPFNMAANSRCEPPSMTSFKMGINSSRRCRGEAKSNCVEDGEVANIEIFLGKKLVKGKVNLRSLFYQFLPQGYLNICHLATLDAILFLLPHNDMRSKLFTHIYCMCFQTIVSGFEPMREFQKRMSV